MIPSSRKFVFSYFKNSPVTRPARLSVKFTPSALTVATKELLVRMSVAKSLPVTDVLGGREFRVIFWWEKCVKDALTLTLH